MVGCKDIRSRAPTQADKLQCLSAHIPCHSHCRPTAIAARAAGPKPAQARLQLCPKGRTTTPARSPQGVCTLTESRPSQFSLDWKRPTEALLFCPNPPPRRTFLESQELYL